MEDSLSIEEEMHSFWTKATYSCGILSILVFLIYLSVEDPLWSSILGLIAFIFFSLTVLGSLKILSGPLTVTLKTDERHLLVTYNKNLKIIQEEQFEKATIKKVSLSSEDRNRISSYLLPEAAALKVHFTDTENRLFLFEFGGRPLFFNRVNLKQIHSFLEAHHIDMEY